MIGKRLSRNWKASGKTTLFWRIIVKIFHTGIYTMTRTVFCVKLNQEAEGMLAPPFPGEFGEKIYNQVSRQAWSTWLSHQTMLINEYRLNLLDPKAREFLRTEMQKWFFGEGSSKPAGYTPE
jgi:Fe-S cluster biosynthesis and repair protein YggX